MTHEDYMRIALDEARKGWGNTQSNPMVGALIVENGEIVSRGHHAVYGGPHAEIEVLNNLGRSPSPDAIMYVTLEPCSSTGKTGPCTEAIKKSGIQNVVIGAIDPDQRHQGNGVEILKDAGIQTTVEVLADECEALNLIFNHTATTGMPFLAAKTATTLDGKVSTRSGNSKWITGDLARQDVMYWRRYFPGIAVGAGTVLADDPSLTSLWADSVRCGKRFIFDRSLRTLEQIDLLKVYNDEFREETILVCLEGSSPINELSKKGVEVWEMPADDGAFWSTFKTRCIQNGITGVYFEGGPGLLSEVLASRQLDYLFAYRAPKFLADAEAPDFVSGQSIDQMSQAYSLDRVQHAVFGEDQLMRGFINYHPK